MTPGRRVTIGLAVLAGAAMITFVVWKTGGGVPGPAAGPAEPVAAATGSPPPPGFVKMLDVFARGGTALELGDAFACLDAVAQADTGLAPAWRDALHAAMERGTPEGMAEGPWSHLFNCGCNAMETGPGPVDERHIALLERVAVDDPRLVMRLYALQHLGVCYEPAGPDTKERLRALVQKLLDDPATETAGTALVLWRQWNAAGEPGKPAPLEPARAIAADTTRPVDVRVSALHSIGDDPRSLDLARAIAPDKSQPVVLRKAALNLIGRHGGENDLTTLRQCSGESPRLAQAGDPAAQAIGDRLAGKPEPVLHRVQ